MNEFTEIEENSPPTLLDPLTLLNILVHGDLFLWLDYFFRTHSLGQGYWAKRSAPSYGSQ